jgi:hypothetical protein
MQPNDSALRNAFRDAVAGSRRNRVKRAAEPVAVPHAILIYVPGEPVKFEEHDVEPREALTALKAEIERLLLT